MWTAYESADREPSLQASLTSFGQPGMIAKGTVHNAITGKIRSLRGDLYSRRTLRSYDGEWSLIRIFNAITLRIALGLREYE